MIVVAYPVGDVTFLFFVNICLAEFIYEQGWYHDNSSLTELHFIAALSGTFLQMRKDYDIRIVCVGNIHSSQTNKKHKFSHLPE